jgi:hypothetical protein
MYKLTEIKDSEYGHASKTIKNYYKDILFRMLINLVGIPALGICAWGATRIVYRKKRKEWAEEGQKLWPKDNKSTH